MAFSVSKTENINEVVLKIDGSLDETGMITSVPSANIIRLDLSRLKGISSAGIRNFIFWGDGHQQVRAIRLENCPSIFVKNFNMISGFLKPNMILISFFVPFYSPDTQEQTDVLFMREREFYPDGRYIVPEIKDSTGKQMDIDVDVDTYFKFLQP